MKIVRGSVLPMFVLVACAAPSPPPRMTPIAVVVVPPVASADPAGPTLAVAVDEFSIEHMIEPTAHIPDVRLRLMPIRQVRRVGCAYILEPTGQAFDTPILARLQADRLGFTEDDIQLLCSFFDPSP